MFYVAKPIKVDAYKIIEIGKQSLIYGTIPMTLEDNSKVVALLEMISRFIPVVGDYWVVQADGYTYLNPKAVFESKYQLILTNQLIKE